MVVQTGVVAATYDHDEPVLGTRSIQRDMKMDMMRFAEFDDDKDSQLTFANFYAMMGRGVRKRFSKDDIRSWFDSADYNGDGFLDVNDYFRWALCNAARRHSLQELRNIFAEFDPNGSGLIDSLEFERLACEVGFGSASFALFSLLDANQSGTVSYAEIFNNMGRIGAGALDENKQMDEKKIVLHSALADAYDGETKASTARPTIDTRRWEIKGQSVPAILKELRKLLVECGHEVMDLIMVFHRTANNTFAIDLVEYIETMRTKFAFTGDVGLLIESFTAMDCNRDTYVCFDDFFEFVRGRKHSLDNRRKLKDIRLHLQPESQVDPMSGELVTPTLEVIAWDPEALRTLIKQMLSRNDVGTTDLMQALSSNEHDDHGTRRKPQIGIRDFCEWMKQLFFSGCSRMEQLWYRELHNVVQRAFRDILAEIRGGNHSLMEEFTVVHLQKWLDGPLKREGLPLKPPKPIKRTSPFPTSTMHQSQAGRGKIIAGRDSAPQSSIAAAPAGHAARATQRRPHYFNQAGAGICNAVARHKLIADAKELTKRHQWEVSSEFMRLEAAGPALRKRRSIMTPPAYQHLETPYALLELPPLKARIAHRRTIEARQAARLRKLEARAMRDTQISRSYGALPDLRQPPRTVTWTPPISKLAASHSLSSLGSSRFGGTFERYSETHSQRSAARDLLRESPLPALPTRSRPRFHFQSVSRTLEL